MFRFTILTIFALAATFVAAQSTTSASGGSDDCSVTCTATASTAAGCTLSDTATACVCSNPFQTAFANCIQQRCPDQSVLITVYQQVCAGVSNPSGTPSGGPSASASASGTSTPDTSAPSTSRPSTTAPASNGTGTPTSSTASVSRSGAAFKNAPVAGAMGALAALVGAAIF